MWDQDIEKLNNLFSDIESNGRRFLSNISEEKHDQENIKILSKFLDNIDFFKNNILSFSDLLSNQYVYDLIRNDLGSIAGEFRSTINLTNLFDAELNRVIDTLNAAARKMHDVLRDLNIIKAVNSRLSEVVEPLVENALTNVKTKVDKIDAALLAIEQHETDKIYLGLSEKYKWEYFRNNGYFFITLIIVGCVSWNYSTSLEQISNFTNGVLIAFIAFKILLISIAITLITLFLRRSSHAKKLQDQAYQTHVEISAFPIHVRSLNEDDQHSLVKELAMKYFGKELDHSQTDKAGDLMAEQIRISTEMVKASAEMVKSVKPSGASESSEPK